MLVQPVHISAPQLNGILLDAQSLLLRRQGGGGRGQGGPRKVGDGTGRTEVRGATRGEDRDGSGMPGTRDGFRGKEGAAMAEGGGGVGGANAGD